MNAILDKHLRMSKYTLVDSCRHKHTHTHNRIDTYKFIQQSTSGQLSHSRQRLRSVNSVTSFSIELAGVESESFKRTSRKGQFCESLIVTWLSVLHSCVAEFVNEVGGQGLSISSSSSKIRNVYCPST